MWRRRFALVVCLVTCLWQPTEVSAQLAVHDALAYIEHVLTAVRTLEMAQSIARDLAPLVDLERIARLSIRLGLLINEIDALIAEMSSRDGQWAALREPPCNPMAAATWMQQARQVQREGVEMVRRMSRILMLSREALGILNEVFEIIRSLIGNLQGLQTINATLVNLNSDVVGLQLMTAGVQEVMTGQALIEYGVAMATACMAGERMQGFGE